MELSESTRQLLVDTQSWIDEFGEHIEIAYEDLFEAWVCTDLPDEEVDAAMAKRPGSRNGWTRSDTGNACEDKPATHRHLAYAA